jgi:hypothetical protein
MSSANATANANACCNATANATANASAILECCKTPCPPTPPTPPIPPPPKYNKKVVALLDFAYSVDLNIKETIEYYYTNFSFLYQPFEIINTNFDIENTLNLLNTYYNKGARYFILTSHSNIVLACVDWFRERPDALGWTPYAQSDALEVTKKIYTMSPLFNQKLFLYSESCIVPYDTIYYLYSPSILFSQTVLISLQKTCDELGKTLVPIGTLNNPSDFTEENVNAMLQTIPEGQSASIIVAYAIYSQLFYNSFNTETYKPEYLFYETAIYPIFETNQSAEYFNNILYITSTSQGNMSASYLWQIGYQNFNVASYGATVLNTLDMINGQINNEVIAETTPAQNDTLSFDVVNKTIQGVSVPLLKFVYDISNNSELFLTEKIYYQNEQGVKYSSLTSDFNYNPVPKIKIMPPSGMTKKAAALLELTGGYIEGDRRILQTLYYIWSTTNNFIQFPIYDTEGRIDKTLALLDSCYSKGIKLFYGFSRSTVLAPVINWFKEHPDAIGISASSSANSLSIPKNIYRLQIVDSYAIESINFALENTINNGGRIFYVYSANELASDNALNILKNNYGAENIIEYPVLSDKSNLTQVDLQNFYSTNNVSAIDTVVVYLFISDQSEVYLNLFDSNLIIPASQYEMTLGGYPKINSSTTSLNGLYNVLVLQNVTNSALWDSCNQNLKLEQFSSNTVNALYMLTQFSKNNSEYTLGSYDGTLQFNEFKDIKYGSITNYLYNNGTFNDTYIYCADPLYGQLKFEQI